MKYLPVTYAVMTIGTIAITGLGIPGVELGFAGFYSKDSLIHAAFSAGQAVHRSGSFAFATAPGRREDLEHHWHNRDHAQDDADGDADHGHADAAHAETHSEPDHGDHQ